MKLLLNLIVVSVDLGLYFVNAKREKLTLKENWYEEEVYLFNRKSEIWYINGGLEPLRDTTVDKHFTSQIEELGLRNIRIHDLRHSYASLLINGGINIKIISEMMGHFNVEITWNRYGHLYPNAQDKATDYIDSI